MCTFKLLCLYLPFFFLNQEYILTFSAHLLRLIKDIYSVHSSLIPSVRIQGFVLCISSICCLYQYLTPISFCLVLQQGLYLSTSSKCTFLREGAHFLPLCISNKIQASVITCLSHWIEHTQYGLFIFCFMKSCHNQTMSILGHLQKSVTF